ncbi:helix-turn-helix domain-containing protein [Photobacterium toruni]|uniref:Helix-turn-helix domain-containing protein n=1 Tax=Photobacterium toruni TaxID=1935446 RepID=A0ABU6L6X8_9GAMM|nr:helix-turn-helix domain-containing protein [Photobacterium toruni]
MDDLSTKPQKTTNARMRLRLLAVYYFIDGKSRYQIARYLKVSRTSVNKWITQYLNYGFEGLKEKNRSGRPSRLNNEQCHKIQVFITENAIKSQGQRLRAKDIQTFIYDEYQITYQSSMIYNLLKQWGFSWVIGHSKHLKQSIQTQIDCKNTSH